MPCLLPLGMILQKLLTTLRRCRNGMRTGQSISQIRGRMDEQSIASKSPNSRFLMVALLRRIDESHR